MLCDDCPAVGPTLENLLCALDICDPEVVSDQEYLTLVSFGDACVLEDTYEAVAQFGDETNDLAPKLNDSYALVATGPAEGTEHSTSCDDYLTTVTDPYTGDLQDIHDAMQWRLTLIAPADAEAFRFKYVFLSEEYDDYISSDYNDRFYVVLEAGSTNDGQPTIINFTQCRNPGEYYDFLCGPGDPACTEGEPYCYVAINSASIALMSDDLRRIPFLVRISRSTRRVINQNLAFGVTFIILGISLSKFIPAGLAAVLHFASSLVVVFNSARLVRHGEELDHESHVPSS